MRSLTEGTEGPEIIVARYGELWLKGKNRPQFEKRLTQNVRKAIEPITSVRVERGHGQLVVFPDARAREVSSRLQEVFGLSSVSPARGTSPNAEAIAETAEVVLGETLEGLPSDRSLPFRVETKRSDKSFPMISMELDRFVADRLMPRFGERLTVDLSNPELVLGINVRPERAYVFAERFPGAGGLPVGTVGRVVSLLSGGIDSPVASWMAMKRGCEVVYAAFHSYPYIGASFLKKIRRIVRSLARFQTRSVLISVPFTEIQTEIRDRCPEPYRTVLYRRMMQRIAVRLAVKARATAVVTGDSLGQVASQTLENMACIEAASELPLLRPLIAFDKTETIAQARRIGTFELSIEPEPDCCTVFQPTRPIIRGSLHACENAESALDVGALIDSAVERSERSVL